MLGVLSDARIPFCVFLAPPLHACHQLPLVADCPTSQNSSFACGVLRVTVRGLALHDYRIEQEGRRGLLHPPPTDSLLDKRTSGEVLIWWQSRSQAQRLCLALADGFHIALKGAVPASVGILQACWLCPDTIGTGSAMNQHPHKN